MWLHRSWSSGFVEIAFCRRQGSHQGASSPPGMKPSGCATSGTVRPRPRPPKTRGGTLSWDIEHAPSAANPVVQWPSRTHPLTEFRLSHSGMRPGVRTARSQRLRIRPRLDATATAPGATAAPLRLDTDTASMESSAAWTAPAARPPSKVASDACSAPSQPRTSRKRISGRSRP